MLDIVQFENGRYGIQNSMTGIVLPHQYRWVRSAVRKRNRITRHFNKTFSKILR